jgi:outer membrane murein-binding lipoprotein Lpp
MGLQEMESQQQKSEESEQYAPEAKTSYQERIGAELKDWAAKVDRLKADVEELGTEAGRMVEKRIEILKDKRKAAVRKLSTLKRSPEEGWEGFKSGLEKSLDDLKQTLDQTLSTFRKRQQEITERVSKQRKAYLDNIEVRFSDWNAKVDALKTRIERAKNEAVTKYEQQIEELRKKQLIGKEKLEEFKKSGGESWKDLKEGMDKAFEDMKKSFEKALSRMKKK